jgi:hypothetical protein
MIGIQLPEKYKENSTFRSKALAFIFTFIKAHVILGLRSKRRSSPCILQVVASLSMRIFQLDWNGYIQSSISKKVSVVYLDSTGNGSYKNFL